MKSYGFDMIGRFVLERVSSLPTFNVSRDKGRLIYDESVGQCYFGSDSAGISMSPDYVTLNDHESRIATNENDIDGLETDVSNLEPRVTTNENDIDGLETDVSDHIDSNDEHPLATQSSDGFMSSSDKTRLDGLDMGYATFHSNTRQEAYNNSIDIPNDGSSYNIGGRIERKTDSTILIYGGHYYRIFGIGKFVHVTNDRVPIELGLYDKSNNSNVAHTRPRAELSQDAQGGTLSHTVSRYFSSNTRLALYAQTRNSSSTKRSKLDDVTLSIEVY